MIGAANDELGFFRCKSLDLAKLVVSKTQLESFRKYIYFKYVFLVGGTQAILDSPVVNAFLQALIQGSMKPFAVYLVKATTTREEISKGPFQHLLLEPAS